MNCAYFIPDIIYQQMLEPLAVLEGEHAQAVFVVFSGHAVMSVAAYHFEVFHKIRKIAVTRLSMVAGGMGI